LGNKPHQTYKEEQKDSDFSFFLTVKRLDLDCMQRRSVR